jgi:hypothetical protein
MGLLFERLPGLFVVLAVGDLGGIMNKSVTGVGPFCGSRKITRSGTPFMAGAARSIDMKICNIGNSLSAARHFAL